MRGHEEASGTAYVPKHLFEEWAAKDPVARFEQWLTARGLLDEATREKLRADLKPVIDVLVDEALAAPDPVSSAESELADVYAPSALSVEGPEPSAPAAGEALRRRHPGRPARGHAPAARDRPHRPGHRGVRRRVQGHGRLRRRVRQGARAQHPDHRVGRGRRGPGPGPRRLPPDGRDAVRRLHHLRLQPDRQQPGQDALPLGRGGAGGGAGARGRRHGRGAVPLAERRGLVHPRRGPEGGRPRHAVRREGTPDRGFRGRQPRPLPRAQAPVPLRPRAGPVRLVHRCRWARRGWRAKGRTRPS